MIDAALEFTRETHLLGRSIRALAARPNIAPSVVHHHVGGKDRIARHVVERVLTDLTVPTANLEWPDWFRLLLRSIHLLDRKSVV